MSFAITITTHNYKSFMPALRPAHFQPSIFSCCFFLVFYSFIYFEIYIVA